MGDTIQNIKGSIIATRGAKAVAYGDVAGKRTQNCFANADLRNAVLNVESTITQHIARTPHADQKEKRALSDLTRQLIDQLMQAPPEEREEVEAILEATKQLLAIAAQKEPNKPMLKVIASGLKQAAKNIAEALPKVLDVASQLIGLISKMIL